MRFAPEGLLLILLSVVICAALWVIFWFFPAITQYPAIIMSAATCGLMFFFRDPLRQPPTGDKLILAPADGKILPFTRMDSDENYDYKTVSIFLSLFDVHVNRSPVSGSVVDIKYKPGKFYPAYNPRSSSENEMNQIDIDTPQGRIVMRQVAGLVARRIVCHLTKGWEVAAGDRIGIIKFGSRVDLILPPQVILKVKPGVRVKAGETIIGIWLND